jgi:hypothetical protein
LAKRWRSPVAIGTKSGRQRRAPLFFVSRCPHAEEHRRAKLAHALRQLGCAAKHADATTGKLSSLETHTLVRVCRGHLACARLRMRTRQLPAFAGASQHEAHARVSTVRLRRDASRSMRTQSLDRPHPSRRARLFACAGAISRARSSA